MDDTSGVQATPRETPAVLATGLLFLLSGAAALVYQVAWQRLLALHSGIGLYSVAMIVAAFMAGLGIGSQLGGRLSTRLDGRTALLAFAALEIGIGLFGALERAPGGLYDACVAGVSKGRCPSLRTARLYRWK